MHGNLPRSLELAAREETDLDACVLPPPAAHDLDAAVLEVRALLLGVAAPPGILLHHMPMPYAAGRAVVLHARAQG